MVCYHPLYALRFNYHLNPKTGKNLVRVIGNVSTIENPRFGNFVDSSGRSCYGFTVGCGKCIGCRLEYSRIWAVRLMKEAATSKSSCFITLTYDDENLPIGKIPTLYHPHFIEFRDRLRAYIRYHYGKDVKIKYFVAGEYGEKNFRPHYHAIITGFDFPDKVLEYERNGYPHYQSELLTKLWRKGRTETCEVTFDTCAYVARYICKKITGEAAKDYYDGFQQEYATCSKGIGLDWYKRYKRDVYNNDYMVIYRHDQPYKMRPPRYFDYNLEKEDPALLEFIKAKRERAACLKPFEGTRRLLDKEKYKQTILNKTIHRKGDFI